MLTTIATANVMDTARLISGEILFMVRSVLFAHTFRCLRILVAVPMPHSTKPSSAKPPTM